MKRFIWEGLAFTMSLCGLIVLGILMPDLSNPQPLHYAVRDKHDLLRNTPGPRVILVGGSNLSFGLNSARIQESLNVNIVNAGLHAGYGMKYILEDVKPHIRAGDTIILVPEYSFFYGNGFWGTGALLPQVIDACPENRQYLTAAHWTRLLRYIMGYAFNKLNLARRDLFSTTGLHDAMVGDYERRSFNEFGDVHSHWRKPRPYVSPRGIKGSFNKESVNAIRTLDNYISRRGASMYLSFPSFQESSYLHSSAQIHQVEEALLALDIPVLGSAERYVFPDSLCYDTEYHLTKGGVDLRTARLIADMSRAGLVR